MGDDITHYRILAWIGFILWGIATPWITFWILKSAVRGGGPFAITNAMVGITNLIEASIYLWTLYHLQGRFADWSIYIILGAVIYRALTQILLGLMIRRIIIHGRNKKQEVQSERT